MKKMRLLSIALLSASIARPMQASQLNKLGKQLMVGAGIAGVVTYLAWKMGPQKIEEPLPTMPSSPGSSCLDQLPLDKAQEQHQKDRERKKDEERKESFNREAQKTLGHDAFLQKIRTRDCVARVDVCMQTGASCGKNAVENGAIYFEFLTRTKRFQNLNEPAATGRLKELLAAPKVSDDWWREDRVQEEVSRLMQPDQYTVIRNIHNFDPRLVEDPEVLIKAINTLRNTSNVAHTFLLGNMQEYLGARGEMRGKNGHWIAVTVAKKNLDQYEYYVMDSFNRDRTEWVEPLQYLVECDDMLRLQLACLEHYVSSAEDKLNNPELRVTYVGRSQQEPRTIRSLDDSYRLNGAIDALNKLITTAREFNVLETQAFIEKYNDRIQTIIDTIEKRSRIEHVDIHDRVNQIKRYLTISLPSQERKDRADEKNNV